MEASRERNQRPWGFWLFRSGEAFVSLPRDDRGAGAGPLEAARRLGLTGGLWTSPLNYAFLEHTGADPSPSRDRPTPRADGTPRLSKERIPPMLVLSRRLNEKILLPTVPVTVQVV